MQYVTLEDTVYLHFVVNTVSGAGTDGDVAGTGTGTGEATCDVRQAGDSQSAAPVYSSWPYLLTHANYPDGCYEVAVPATAANGFAANKTYAVFCSMLVSGVNPTGMVGLFRTAPVPANVTQTLGTAVSVEDLTLSAATSSTVTLPTALASGTSIADNDQYEYTVWRVVAGAGEGQLVVFVNAAAGARQYNIIQAVTPDALGATSKLVLLHSYRSRDHSGAALALASTIGTPVSLGSGATLADNLQDMAHDGVGTGGTYDRTTDSLEAVSNRLPAALGANGNIKADVRDFNGTAGTFSSGRPEVNTTHWGGTAVASAVVNANAVQLSGDTTAADNLETMLDGTGGSTLSLGRLNLYNPTISPISIIAGSTPAMVITSDAPDAPTVYVMSSGNTAVSMIGNHATEAVLSVINGGGGPTLSSAPKEEITDTALSRSVSYSEASAAEHSLASLILAALESSLSGTTWTIKRTDGSTIHITKTVTTSGSVDPITGVS